MLAAALGRLKGSAVAALAPHLAPYVDAEAPQPIFEAP
jgi:hypothetical protein